MEITHFTGKINFSLTEMSFADEEVRVLIGLWGEEEVQRQLEGCKRNREVYGELARKLRERATKRPRINAALK